MFQIISTGKSRLPLYSKRRSNIKGLIITKRLIGCDPNAKIPMRDLKLYRGHDVKLMHEKRPLFEALNDFQEGEHLAVVTRAVSIKDQSGEVEYQASVRSPSPFTYHSLTATRTQLSVHTQLLNRDQMSFC